MKTNHLSEDQIQQIALGEVGGEPSQVTHLEACESCQNRVNNYRELFLEINAMPHLAFDFNVTALVEERLPPLQSSFQWMTLMLSFAAVVLLVSLSIFWETWFSLIWNELARVVCYLVLPTAAYLFVGQVVILITRYKKRMDQLKYY